MEAGLAPPEVSPATSPSPGIALASGEVQDQTYFCLCPFFQGLMAGMLRSPQMPDWPCLVKAKGKAFVGRVMITLPVGATVAPSTRR